MTDMADKRMLPTSLYRGKRMIGYRESLGGDNKWHAQVVLEGLRASSSTKRRG
jgi:hypothetical protein